MLVNTIETIIHTPYFKNPYNILIASPLNRKTINNFKHFFEWRNKFGKLFGLVMNKEYSET